MKLYFNTIGSGEKTILILHGMYGSGDNWLSIANKFADNYSILLPDMRNHGKSPHSSIHNYRAMAEDILELIHDNKIAKTNIIGHSMGGKTAMFFTAKYPEFVEKLVVVDISPKQTVKLIEESPNALFHLNLINTLLEVDFSKAGTLREAQNILADKISDKRLIGFLLKNTVKKNGKFNWQMNLKALRQNLPEIMEGLNIDDFIDKKIENPTLFLKGSSSDYITNSDFKFIDFIFSNNKILTISEAGHWMHSEQPEAVFNAIDLFFNE
jgi:esterase